MKARMGVYNKRGFPPFMGFLTRTSYRASCYGAPAASRKLSQSSRPTTVCHRPIFHDTQLHPRYTKSSGDRNSYNGNDFSE